MSTATPKVVWKGPPKLRRSLVAISDLEPWPDNPRRGDIPSIKGSLKRFGQVKHVVVRGMRIVAGHHIVLAALELGWTHVAVMDGEFADEEEARAFLVADNHIPELGTIDEEALAVQLAALSSFDGTGYTATDWRELESRLAALSEAPADPDPIDLPAAAKSVRGEVYELGRHRLMCGDSTSTEDVLTLTGGVPSEMIWTDPPYGVDYVGKTADKLTIENDSALGLREFLLAAWQAVTPALAPSARFYCASPAGMLEIDFLLSLADAGWRVHQTLMWVKDVFVLGHSDYHYQHEDIIYGYAPGEGRPGRGDHAGSRWYGGHNHSTVFQVARPKRSKEHPCLPPGEFVLTDEGFEPIETVAVGRRVYSHDGLFHRVEAAFASPCSGPVYEIDVDGTNLTTTATGNHPFLAWQVERKNKRIMGGNVCWTRADELKPGDYLLTPVSQLAGSSCDDVKSLDWWFAAGLWCAEGHVHSNQHGGFYPGYTIGQGKEELIDRLRGTFRNVLAYPRPGATQVVVTEKSVVGDFVRMIDRGAVNKRIRPEVLEATDECRRSFLDGYLAGDGCVVRGAHRMKTASLRLASTLPLLLESLGMRSSMYRHDATGREAFIDGRSIKQGIYFQLYPCKGTGNKPMFVEHDGIVHSVRRVSSVTEHEYSGPVWNLTVEDAHTFQTAVGMSHNTMKPVELIVPMIEVSSLVDDHVLDPFSGSGSTLIACEQTRRSCFAMEVDPRYVDVAIYRWENLTGEKARRA